MGIPRSTDDARISARSRPPATERALRAGAVECWSSRRWIRPRGRPRFGRRLLVKRGRDVADADDADQAVIVDHGQMADVMLVHQVTRMLERVGRSARDQLLHRDQLRDLHVDAGGAVLGDGAHHVALGEHADGGVAFGAHDVLDHQRADIAGAHQLRGDGDGLVHADRCDTGGFLAQDVSDLHRNLLGLDHCAQCWYTLCQLSTLNCDLARAKF